MNKNKELAMELIAWEENLVAQYQPKIPIDQQIKDNGTPNLRDYLQKYLSGDLDKYYEKAFGL